MRIINVKASTSYKIYLGYNLLDNIKDYLQECNIKLDGIKIAIITDDIVDRLYIDKLNIALEGLNTYKYVFINGEKSKSGSTYLDIMSFLAKNQFNRQDIILALGGGVVGDIAGFVASTYMRGIKFAQIPTTLLAMIDSSVGGKTAIDLKEGKNLVGSFYQPCMVLADLNMLNTLTETDVKNGLGELVKYGILCGGKLWEYLKDGYSKENLIDIIELCISYKRDIVEADECEMGVRKLLNLGHTIAHSIEKLSDYSIPHGIAVAMGIKLIASVSLKVYNLNKNAYDTIISTLDKVMGMSLDIPYSIEQIAQVAAVDKKASYDKITLVLIEDIGKCGFYKSEIASLKEVLK